MLRYLNLIKNIANWHLHFLIKLGMTKDDPLVFIARNNIIFEVPKRLHHEFKEIFLENAYSIGLRKKLRKNPTIIDIGANVGFFTMFAASKYPNCTVYAYEPIESNFRQLQKNKELNSTNKIHCFNKALCGHRGTIKIRFDAADSFTTSATILNTTENEDKLSKTKQYENIKAIEVPCLRLFDVFEEHKIDRCDLLKLDCEGAEYEVLYNAPEEVLSNIDQMAIEVHEGKGSNENLLSLKKFLTTCHFELFQFVDKPHMLWAYRDRSRQ